MDKQKKKGLQNMYKERKITGGICAVKNSANGKMLLSAVVNLQGCKNRFEFSKMTDSCIEKKLEKDWNKYGKMLLSLKCSRSLIKRRTRLQKSLKMTSKL